MERRRGKKKQLKWRILGSIALILAVSMTIPSLAGYWYFERIVREQKISDERSRLIQVSGQLTFLAEDIRQFASDNPEIAAQMIRSWLRGGEENG